MCPNTGDKWFIHDSKHPQENKLLNPKLSCRLYLVWIIYCKYHINDNSSALFKKFGLTTMRWFSCCKFIAMIDKYYATFAWYLCICLIWHPNLSIFLRLIFQFSSKHIETSLWTYTCVSRPETIIDHAGQENTDANNNLGDTYAPNICKRIDNRTSVRMHDVIVVCSTAYLLVAAHISWDDAFCYDYVQAYLPIFLRDIHV